MADRKRIWCGKNKNKNEKTYPMHNIVSTLEGHNSGCLPHSCFSEHGFKTASVFAMFLKALAFELFCSFYCGPAAFRLS